MIVVSVNDKPPSAFRVLGNTNTAIQRVGLSVHAVRGIDWTRERLGRPLVRVLVPAFKVPWLHIGSCTTRNGALVPVDRFGYMYMYHSEWLHLGLLGLALCIVNDCNMAF